jgi:hypothetical protein
MGYYGGGGLMLDRASRGMMPGWRGQTEAVENSGGTIELGWLGGGRRRG